MRQNVAYDTNTDNYEIYDDYGGSMLDIKIIKILIKVIKKTHPELLEDFK